MLIIAGIAAIVIGVAMMSWVFGARCLWCSRWCCGRSSWS